MARQTFISTGAEGMKDYGELFVISDELAEKAVLDGRCEVIDKRDVDLNGKDRKAKVVRFKKWPHFTFMYIEREK